MTARGMVDVAIVLLLCSQCLHPASAQTDRQISLQRKYTGHGYSLCGSCNQPREIFSTLQLSPENEPGEPMILSGTIYHEDGITPDSGVTLFLYQTDSGGYYHRPKEDVFHPRIFGWLRTGKDGRYEVHTIRPAPEIATPKEPAHIHVHIFSQEMPEHFLHEFWFKGDIRITAEDNARFAKLGNLSPVVALTMGSDGIWRGTRDIRIRPAAQWRYETD